VGPEVGSEEGWLLSSHPIDPSNPRLPTSGWKVSSDSGISVNPGAWWVRDPSLIVEGLVYPSCLQFFLTSSPVSPLRDGVLGNYTMHQDLKHNGFPVWENKDGEQSSYYLYLTNSSLWLVGREVGREDGWILSSQPSPVSVPEQGWRVSTDSGDGVNHEAWWMSEPNLRVEVGSPYCSEKIEKKEVLQTEWILKDE